MNYLIYQFMSPTGKLYIGQTKNLKSRINAHKSKWNCYAFHDAIQKHGYENFKLEIIKENLTLEEANFWESFYIREKNTISPNGYNLESGGDNKKCHPDTAKKRGEKLKGKKRTLEQIERIRLSNVGRKASEEAKEKMRIAKLGKKASNETKLKMSKAQKGRKFSEESKEKLKKSLLESWTDERKEKAKITQKGKIISDETKEKLSIAIKKKCQEPEYKEKVSAIRTGKKRSEESKLKTSEKLKGRVFSEDHLKKLKEAWIIRKKNENQ